MVDMLHQDPEHKSVYEPEEYPQVRKTGVDAVHESRLQRSNI